MTRARRRAARSPRLVWSLAICVALFIALIVILRRDATPMLDPSMLRVAQARWYESQPSNYTIVLRKKIDGQSAEQIRTTVRDFRVVDMRINDVRMDSVRDSYTVEGLFDMIEREHEMASASTRASGQPVNATLKAKFDPETGIPVEFKRLASQRSFFLTVEKVHDPQGGPIFPPPRS